MNFVLLFVYRKRSKMTQAKIWIGLYKIERSFLFYAKFRKEMISLPFAPSTFFHLSETEAGKLKKIKRLRNTMKPVSRSGKSLNIKTKP